MAASTIPGFYDGVDPVPAATRKQWQAPQFPGAEVSCAMSGSRYPAGEKGYPVHEQIWSRPTAEFNGIWGGYTGAGSKTVLPARPCAKLTFRLVGRQKPDAHPQGPAAHSSRRACPGTARCSFNSQGGDSSGGHGRRGQPLGALAGQALKAEWGRAPVLMADGGSIPVVGTFKIAARHRQPARRLCARRRQRPQPEREIRPEQLSQGHPQLGPHHRRRRAHAAKGQIMTDIDTVLAAADKELEASLERLFDLVRIPSISTDPAYKAECREAAERLSPISLRSASMRACATRRAIRWSWRITQPGARRSRRTFSFYGHYDVQPPDPLDKWATPPFEPVRKRRQGRRRAPLWPRHCRRQGPAHDLHRGDAGLDHGHGARCRSARPS